MINKFNKTTVVVISIGCFTLITANSLNAQVGIGTLAPKAGLHVADSTGVLFSAPYLTPNPLPPAPAQGTGRRMMWYPGKAAFRVGYVSDNKWDTDSIGQFSFAGSQAKATNNMTFAFGDGAVASGFTAIALGTSAKASGLGAMTFGFNSTSSGGDALAMGYGNTSSGNYSVAIGRGNISSGNYSATMGASNNASGNHSTVIGHNSLAIGNYTIAIGYEARTTGSHSITLGNNVNAIGNNCVAIGSNASTNGFNGSFIFSDASNKVAINSQVNQMMMRFSGGYYLFSDSLATLGVRLPANGNSWATISDSTKKENYLLADGQIFLSKIKKMKLGSWNYRGQEKKQYRHYGPMAQEFYSLFGHDGIGTIGNDTTIAAADIDGVMLIAIQALVKENEELKKELATQGEALTVLRDQNQNLNARLDKIEVLMEAKKKYNSITKNP